MMGHLLALTNDDFIKWATEVHNYRYNYSLVKYINGRTKIEIICPTHGIFTQLPPDHLHGSNCPECAKINRQINHTKTHIAFIKEAMNIHKNKYNYSLTNYAGILKKIKIICPEHNMFLQRPNDHLTGHGCKKCGIKSRNDLLKKSIENFILEAKKVHKDKYDYSFVDYKNTMSYISIFCKKHNSCFKQRPYSHISKKAGCPKCSINISKKEYAWLNYMNVPDVPANRQTKIYINKKLFKVDGFIPETNTVYEFWGDYWHGNPQKYNPLDINKNSKKTFQYLYEKTLIKRKMIIDAGYMLIGIWENDWDKLMEVMYVKD